MLPRCFPTALILAVFGATITIAHAKPQLPGWGTDAIQSAVRLATEANGSASPSVDEALATILLDEKHMTVRPDGTRDVRIRYIVRIENAAARDRAVARVRYEADRRRKPTINAWLVSPNGKVKLYGRRQYVDRADHPNSIVTESRVLSISAARDVQPGSVFVWEAEYEQSSPFLQLYWRFQQREPVTRSAVTIDVPAEWTVRTVTFNHPPISPIQTGTRYRWELTNLPGIKPEKNGPSLSGLVAAVGIDLVPGGTSPISKNTGSVAWTWDGLSQHFTSFYDEKAKVSPAIAARARGLVDDAATPWERIQRIGEFVQSLTYVSIALDLSRGGGYIPRAAVDTLAQGYGDCKDKTTLMRSLLEAAGIASHAVITYAGDRKYVRAEWPSASMFNHCIIAVRVDDTVESPAVLSHDRLGRLLVFDPTDEFTALGSLASEHQGANVLLIAGADGGLVRLPFDTPADNRVDRTVTARLTTSGSIVATVEERYVGASAARQRAQRQRLSPAAYNKFIADRLAPTLGAVHVGEVTGTQADDGARIDLRVELAARNYAKAMRDKLLILKPVIVARRETAWFADATRMQPIHIEPEAYNETTRIEVPKGFAATDLPESVTLAEPWGDYTASCRAEDGHVIHERSFSARAAELPAGEHEQVRAFFQRIYEAEQTPVVLERRTG